MPSSQDIIVKKIRECTGNYWSCNDWDAASEHCAEINILCEVLVEMDGVIPAKARKALKRIAAYRPHNENSLVIPSFPQKVFERAIAALSAR